MWMLPKLKSETNLINFLEDWTIENTFWHLATFSTCPEREMFCSTMLGIIHVLSNLFERYCIVVFRANNVKKKLLVILS